MTNDEAGRAAQGEPLDFDRADFRDDAPAARCAHCGAGLGDRYFAIGTMLLCGRCSEAIGDWIERGPGAPDLLRAGAFGLGAAAAGAMLWWGVRQVSGYEIGLIAIAVGYFVGIAVRRGSRGLAGPVFQVLAVALTYLAIVAAYVPALLPIVEAQRAPAMLEDEAERGQGADSFVPLERERPGDAALPLISRDRVSTIVEAFGIAIKLPFLMGVDNAMGIIIIGIALWEAWRLNRRARPELSGPYRLRAPPAEALGAR